MLAPIAVTMPGCSDDNDPRRSRRLPDRGSLFVVIGPSAANPRWRGITGGAKRFAATLPQYQFEYPAPLSDDPHARLDVFRTVLRRKPVAVCLFVGDLTNEALNAVRPPAPTSTPIPAPTSAPVTSPDSDNVLSDEIRRADVPIVTIGREIPNLPVAAHIAVAWPAGAQLLGESLQQVSAGRRSFLLVHSQGRDADATKCRERFLLAANQQHELTLLDELNGWTSGLSAREQVETLTARFSSAGLLVTLSPEPWISQRPRCTLPAGMRFATLGSSPPLWHRLRDGDAAALVGPLDGDVGYAALKAAWQALSGESAAFAQPPIACELITRENLDDFARRYAASAGLNPADVTP